MVDSLFKHGNGSKDMLMALINCSFMIVIINNIKAIVN
jgi:hypothetical protein